MVAHVIVTTISDELQITLADLFQTGPVAIIFTL